MCMRSGGNTVDVLISLFQFISRPHPATMTLRSIPSFMVHHLQSILPSSCLLDGLPHIGHMFAEFQRSFLPASLCVVSWEVTSHLNPRSPASYHPPASPGSLLSCPASLCPPPAFTTLLELWLAGLQLWFMTNKALCQQQSERQACKTKANGRLLVMSIFSSHDVHYILEFLPCSLMAIHNLTPEKHGQCVYVRICPGIPSTTLWNYVPASIIKPCEIIACTWQVRFSHF